MSSKVPISSRSAVTVCFVALRNMALSLEKSFSIGFKSGESGGKYTRVLGIKRGQSGGSRRILATPDRGLYVDG